MKSLLLLVIVLTVSVILLVDSVDAARRDGKPGRRKKQKENKQQESDSLSQPDQLSGYPAPASPYMQHQFPGDSDESSYIDPEDVMIKFTNGAGGSSGGSSAFQPSSTHQCEEITVDTCKHIGYNVTSMPNFVGHEIQSDADLQLQTFMPLISYGCSSQLKFFLCSVYFPMCTEKVPVMIGPCRPLCENVRSSCEPVLQNLGFTWPEALNCSKFNPFNSVDQMCMDGPPPDQMETSGPKSNGPSQPLYPPTLPHGGGHGDYEHEHDHYNRGGLQPNQNHFDPYHRPTSVFDPYRPHHPQQPSQPMNPMYPYGSNSFNNPHQPSQQSENTQTNTNHNHNNANNQVAPNPKPKKCHHYRQTEQYVFLDLPTYRQPCVPRCSANILFSSEDKQFVDAWTIVWSCLAITSCFVTLLTFGLSKSAQFRYPERPIIYIAVCYLMYSVTYLYRAIVGRATMSCHADASTNTNLLVAESSYNLHCQLSFVLLYYFGMAGAAWWLILSGTWALSMALRWSSAQLAEHRTLYHSIAWILPMFQTLTAMLTRAVDADELTGTCFVGNQDRDNLFTFVLLPSMFYLCTGILFFVGALVFVRFFSVHSDDEYCPDCSSDSSTRSGSPPVAGTELFLNSQAQTDTETDPNSLHDDMTGTTGCGDFCRKIASCGHGSATSGQSSGSYRQGSTGSGQTLLLPQTVPLTAVANNNFCTVSSTSSYSSSNGHRPPVVQNGHHFGHQQAHFPAAAAANSFPAQSQLNQQTRGFTQQQLAARSASIRASTRGPQRSKRIQNRRSRRVHIRRSPISSAQSINLFHPVLNHQTDGPPNPHQTDGSALIRSGIFALFYILPALIVLACNFYEYYYRDTWVLRSITSRPSLSAVSEAIVTPAPAESQSSSSTDEVKISSLASGSGHESEAHRPNFEMFNMKLFMSLVIGINTGIWIITAKNPINSWRCLLWKCFVKKVVQPVHSSSSIGTAGTATSSSSCSGHHHHHHHQSSQLVHLGPLHPNHQTSNAFALANSSGYQQPSTVHPMTSYPNRSHGQPQLPPRPQQMVQPIHQRPISPVTTYQSAPSDQYFYNEAVQQQHNNLQLSAVQPHPSPCSGSVMFGNGGCNGNGSTATTTTTISGDMLGGGGAAPLGTFFPSANTNLMDNNPMVGPWGEVQFGGAPTRTGNETAV